VRVLSSKRNIFTLTEPALKKSFTSTAMAKVICYGEILWDKFETGKKPGGAPMNVALHLSKQNIDSELISSIGNDKDGEHLKNYLITQGLDPQYIQIHPYLPTGTVEVSLDAEKQASYTIVKPVAWDEIAYQPAFNDLAKSADAIVFGSLASRSSTSRDTLLQLLDNSRLRIFDMNIRPPHFTDHLLRELMGKCDILKINEHELTHLVQHINISTNSLEQQLRRLSEETNIATIAATLGDKGAVILHEEKFFAHPGFKVTVADTVGAGDAFLASFIAGFLEKRDMNKILETACATGALVASKAGANPEYNPAEISKFI
jgi:fructokinase